MRWVWLAVLAASGMAGPSGGTSNVVISRQQQGIPHPLGRDHGQADADADAGANVVTAVVGSVVAGDRDADADADAGAKVVESAVVGPAVAGDRDADADADAEAKVVGSALVGSAVASDRDADADADMAAAYGLYNAAFPGRMSQGQFVTMSHDRRALAELIAEIDAEFELNAAARGVNSGQLRAGSGSGRTTTTATSTASTASTTVAPARTTPFPPEPAKSASTTDGIIFAVLGVPALVFASTAHLYIRPTLFVSGAGSLGYAFYVFSPLAFDNMSTAVHVGASCGCGLLGGLLILCALRVGLFFVGAAVGLVFGVFLSYTPITHEDFFTHPYGYATYYGAFGLFFGLLAGFMQKTALVFSTALSGTFVFMLGVDFFVKTAFTEVVKTVLLDLEQKMKDQFQKEANTNPFEKPAGNDRFKCYAMLAGWAGAIVVTMAIQFYMMRRKEKQESADATERRHDRYAEERADERDRIRERYSRAGNERASWRSKQSRRGRRPERRAEAARQNNSEVELHTAPLMAGTGQGWSVNGSAADDECDLSHEQEQYRERGW